MTSEQEQKFIEETHHIYNGLKDMCLEPLISLFDVSGYGDFKRYLCSERPVSQLLSGNYGTGVMRGHTKLGQDVELQFRLLPREHTPPDYTDLNEATLKNGVTVMFNQFPVFYSLLVTNFCAQKQISFEDSELPKIQIDASRSSFHIGGEHAIGIVCVKK